MAGIESHQVGDLIRWDPLATDRNVYTKYKQQRLYEFCQGQGKVIGPAMGGVLVVPVDGLNAPKQGCYVALEALRDALPQKRTRNATTKMNMSKKNPDNVTVNLRAILRSSKAVIPEHVGRALFEDSKGADGFGRCWCCGCLMVYTAHESVAHMGRTNEKIGVMTRGHVTVEGT